MFKAAYTIDVFLKDHESVQGIEQVVGQYDSKTFDSYFGDIEKKVLELENEYGVVHTRITCNKERPFAIETGFYSTRKHGSEPQFRSWRSVGDWDNLFTISLIHTEYKWLMLYDSSHSAPPQGQEVLCSDPEYRRCWRRNWEMAWWKRTDPEGICSSNPYSPLIGGYRL